MPRSALSFALGPLLAVGACGGAVAPAPATHIVDIPPPRDEAAVAGSEQAHAASLCPPDTLAERGLCVRVVPSPEIQAWEPPGGHGDPCATWTSEKGLVNCDPQNEDPPVDAGKAHR